MLNFVDGADLEVGKMVVVVYGQPNVGKTSLALTASKPVLMDFDGGAYRAGNKSGKAIVPVKAWRDVADVAAEDIADFDTIVIDTVGTALDSLMADIVQKDPRLSQTRFNLQKFGVLKTRFKEWLDQMRLFGKDVVLIAHASEEQRGDDTVDRIVAVGGSKQEIYQQADIMGRISIVGNNRVLSFDPTAASFGKNVGLPDYTVLPPASAPEMLGEIIDKAKGMLNAKAKASQAAHDKMLKLRESLTEAIVDAATANDCLQEMVEEKAGAAERKMLVEVGESKGLKFDRKAKAFVDPEPPEEPDDADGKDGDNLPEPF